MMTMLPGVVVDVAGGKDYTSKADAKIRRIYRSVKSSLLWPLPSIMVQDLVSFAAPWINIM